MSASLATEEIFYVYIKKLNLSSLLKYSNKTSHILNYMSFIKDQTPAGIWSEKCTWETHTETYTCCTWSLLPFLKSALPSSDLLYPNLTSHTCSKDSGSAGISQEDAGVATPALWRASLLKGGHLTLGGRGSDLEYSGCHQATRPWASLPQRLVLRWWHLAELRTLVMCGWPLNTVGSGALTPCTNICVSHLTPQTLKD